MEPIVVGVIRVHFTIALQRHSQYDDITTGIEVGLLFARVRKNKSVQLRLFLFGQNPNCLLKRTKFGAQVATLT